MPSAPSEWCPWWYEYFEASQVLRVPPWELAGFTFGSAAEAHVSWRWWAFEYFQVKASIGAKQQAKMLGALSFGG